jgi:peptidoglycan/LPS O-acetylase OafA/YrhL
VKRAVQLLLGLLLLGIGLLLVAAYPDDEVLFWTGRPLGILVGALGLVYGIGALWRGGRSD